MRISGIMNSLLMLIVIAVFSTPALAGWEVISLHPEGYGVSSALAISNGQQVGYVYSFYEERYASLWSGTAESWTLLVERF